MSWSLAECATVCTNTPKKAQLKFGCSVPSKAELPRIVTATCRVSAVFATTARGWLWLVQCTAKCSQNSKCIITAAVPWCHTTVATEKSLAANCHTHRKFVGATCECLCAGERGDPKPSQCSQCVSSGSSSGCQHLSGVLCTSGCFFGAAPLRKHKSLCPRSLGQAK